MMQVLEHDARPELGDAPFRLLADHLPALCFMADVSGRVLWCNQRWHDYTGVKRGPDVDRAWPRLHHPDNRGEVARRWGHAIASGDAGEMVTPLKGADGQHRPFLTRAEPVRDAQGRITCWLGTMTEITRQQEAERDQRFLLELGDALRDEANPSTILFATGERLAAHLGVARVGYGELWPDGEHVSAGGRGWTEPDMPGEAGVFRLDGFGEAAAAVLRRGEMLAIADVEADPLLSVDAVAAHLALGVRAVVAAPLVKRSRLAAILYVNARAARGWREAEIRLVREVAERTWATLERAQAEAARRQSEERLRLALEGAALGTIQWDLSTVRGRWSKRACAIFGVERGEDITLEQFRAVVHPDDRDRVLREIQAALEGGDQYVAEYRVVRPDGAVRWVISRARVERNADGAPVATAGIVMDVTDRRQAEDRLRESEAHKRAIVETTPECVKIVARDESLVYMNSAGLRMIEADPGSALPPSLPDVIAPEDRALWSRNHARVCAGESLTWEFDIIGLKGARRRMETHAVPLPAADGAMQQLAVTRDVTERKRAEENLRASEARFRGLVETAHEGIWLVDREGRTLFANQRMADLLGVAPETMVGQSVTDFCDPEDLDAARARVRANLAGAAEQFEFRFRRADGATLPVLAATSPLRDGSGQVVGAVGMFSDLTGRHQAEAELQRSREALYQSEKLTALGSLLAGVSHELNNPLSVVLSLSQLLEAKAKDTPFGERAAKIHAAAERCAKIVQTFLAMARQKAPVRTQVDMAALVRAALELTGYGLRTAGIEVSLELADDLPQLNGDADQLTQVLVNLVVNAQHALQERPAPRRLAVRAGADAKARAVVVEVIDNGPGVPADSRRRIFEPFFTTKPQGVGTGIGLTFSLGVVQAHGGALRLTDQPDGGTCFRMELPAEPAAKPDHASASLQLVAPPPERGLALVVDDETDLGEALGEMLEMEGYAVELARSGREAQSRLRARRAYTLVLSDLRMPDLDGPALFEWIERERPDLVTRTAFITGDTLGSAAGRFIAGAGRPVLEKPFDVDSLRELLIQLETPRAVRRREPVGG